MKVRPDFLDLLTESDIKVWWLVWLSSVVVLRGFVGGRRMRRRRYAAALIEDGVLVVGCRMVDERCERVRGEQERVVRWRRHGLVYTHCTSSITVADEISVHLSA
jgi:hypothetical protein